MQKMLCNDGVGGTMTNRPGRFDKDITESVAKRICKDVAKWGDGIFSDEEMISDVNCSHLKVRAS